MNLDRSWD